MAHTKRWPLIVSLVVLVVLLGAAFFYFALAGPNYSTAYASQGAAGTLVNPVAKLSTEEAVAKFDESFVFYLLYEIQAYNLHTPPLSTSKPSILVYVDGDMYAAEISKGLIAVRKGNVEHPDIIIRTTKLEGVLMLQDKAHITQSFQTGVSKIELVASKTTLFAKGYLKLYTSLTGKSITGNVIRIYSG